MRRVYLDNNATTPVHPAVLESLTEALRDVYGNASSVHKEGQAARRRFEDAREAVASLAGATPREIVFTSGGTESNNAAIFGATAGASRHHIVTTGIEHPSVMEPVAELARRGHDVTTVPPERSGRVAAARVIEAIRPNTRLVTMMLANNETGVIQPVAEVAAACRARGIHFHCDAVQAMGKIPVDVKTLQADTLSMSAHKLHAPKGIGALFVRQGLSLDRFILGGAQERRRRAGTENVPLAIAFGVAATIAMDNDGERIGALRDELERRLSSRAGARELGREDGAVPDNSPGLRRTSDPDPSLTLGMTNGATCPRIPNTSNITFAGADSEGIVIGLDLEGVAVSTGSACSSGRVEPSHVLLAMGLTPDEARSTVRFSLSRFTTAEDVETTVRLVQQIVPRSSIRAAANG